MTIKELKRERLKKYLECEEKILINQEYQIGDRTFRRADLAEVRKSINSLLAEGVTLEDEKASGNVKRAIFI